MVKKTNKIKKIRNFLILLLVDFVFLFFVINFIKFMFKKILSFVMSLEDLSINLQLFEENFLENASSIDLSLFSGNLEILNQVMQKIFYYSVYTLIGVFLLYCLFQAIDWNLVCNKFKFKNFGRYLLRFILINIPFGFVLLWIFYGMMYHLRGVVFNSWISGTYLEEQMSFGGSLFALIFLFVLFFVVFYLMVNIYILMNKYKLKETLFRSFNNLKDYKLLLRFFCYVVIFVLFLFSARINLILALVLNLSLVEVFRIDFSRILLK